MSTQKNTGEDLSMTPRERMQATLDGRPIRGRVPHFELVFFLTMEAFGTVHPRHHSFHQWDQMSENERRLHRADMVDTLILTAERFEHSVINIPGNMFHKNGDEELLRFVDGIRERTGDRYFLTANLDATLSIPNGDKMVEFVMRLADEPDAVKRECDEEVNGVIALAEKIAKHGGMDGFTMCRDYCMNEGPFLSPSQFSEFVTPFLAKQVKGMRDLGFYTIKHTDGNIMPILDQMAQCQPHALHSIDPQGGVDLAEVKKLHPELCLVGNVNCGLLDTGTDEEVIESVRSALKKGMPGGRYVFSTSNCIYTGMALERYELMLDIWRKEGNYSGQSTDLSV
jgi:uroporphyrinogen decarboxylase